MATYAVGDIQGQFSEFQALLERCAFDPKRDRLWLVGDLVNRGPESLATLRWVYAQRNAIVTVLGNHDLHLLAVAYGGAQLKTKDTLTEILKAPDRERLLGWLRQQPLVHVERDYCMVHAGLLPQWSVAQAQSIASEIQAQLRGTAFSAFLKDMYGNDAGPWHDGLTGMARWRLALNAFARMRFCREDGVLEFDHKAGAEQAPAGFLPWFRLAAPRWSTHTILFGHWSALGLQMQHGIIALDSGCVWGRALSAVRLEDRQVFQVPCRT